ncbi:MAG: zinc-dependent metalloprotease family protein [Aeromicrobium sp.]
MRKIVSMPIAAAMAAVVLGAAPAHAQTDPTTFVVEGTLLVTAVDTFGSGARADHLYAVVTDEGAEIPVDLGDEDAPANGRFEGELVVAGAVASALDAKDLLPRAGSTIAEDTRAGRAAVAVAEQQETPLTVASSTVEPATAAVVTTPAAHKVYVAVLDNRGTVEESDAQITTLVDGMTSYWTTESDGVIASFGIQGEIKHFDSTLAGSTAQSCGMTSPYAVWAEAARQFPGVSFSKGSRNHLFVAMADECGAGNNVGGIADVGSDFSSGGRMSFSLGSIASQVGVHEIGHTFGLEHANLETCPTTAICEYYDLYSPMGLAISVAAPAVPFTPPALGTLHRAQLGVLGPDEVEDMTLPLATTVDRRTVTLTARGAATGRRGILVTDPVTGATYSIDLRTRTGRDATTFYGSTFGFALPRPTYPAGVVIERQGTSGGISLVTRNVSGRSVGSFPALSTFSPSQGLSVTVSSVGVTAEVTVTRGVTDIQSETPPGPTPGAASGIAPGAAPGAVPPARFAAATPRITGTARVGRTLRVAVGSWSPRPSYRYQWYANGKKITSKGTTSSFRLTSREKGTRITVTVTGQKSGYTTVTKTSARTKKIARKQ